VIGAALRALIFLGGLEAISIEKSKLYSAQRLGVGGTIGRIAAEIGMRIAT
jgi:hypothetical protein